MCILIYWIDHSDLTECLHSVSVRACARHLRNLFELVGLESDWASQRAWGGHLKESMKAFLFKWHVSPGWCMGAFLGYS